MRVTAVEAIPYSLPYTRPARFASGAIDQADNVIVRIHTDEGLVGEAEAQPRPYTYGETQASIVVAIRSRLAPALLGVDAMAIELVHERCARLVGNNAARAAVDVAAWDLFGKALGCSCRALLGGYATDIEVAYMVGFDEPSVMGQTALETHDRFGVRTFKVKVGRALATDLAACRAVREAVPDAAIYVDANRGWSYEEADRANGALGELGVLAIEEPVAANDRYARQRLARGLPIVGDESCMTLADAVRALDERAVRVVSVKTARTGFTESRRIVDFCVARHAPVVVGSQYESTVGAMATAAFAAAFAHTARRPAELVNAFDVDGDLLATPMHISDGRFVVSDAPGVGATLDEDRLDHCRLDDRVLMGTV